NGCFDIGVSSKSRQPRYPSCSLYGSMTCGPSTCRGAFAIPAERYDRVCAKKHPATGRFWVPERDNDDAIAYAGSHLIWLFNDVCRTAGGPDWQACRCHCSTRKLAACTEPY